MGWVTFHTFRHPCASLRFSEGRNIKQVQKWLGHADPSFTLKTYVHLMDEGIGDATFSMAWSLSPDLSARATPRQREVREDPKINRLSRRSIWQARAK
jgi:hypothetical protein